MRVLVSSHSSFWISKEAILEGRKVEALWAQDIPLWGEVGHLEYGEPRPEHFATDEDWRRFDERYDLPDEVPRHDPKLLEVFDRIGGRRMAGWSEEEGDVILEVEVPDDVEYSIHSYCAEWIEERHRRWSTEAGEQWDSWRYFRRDSVYEPRK